MNEKYRYSILFVFLILSNSVIAAGGITPSYYSYYDCKKIDSESLKEDHENEWRTGANQTHPILISSDKDKAIMLWKEYESDTENEGLPRIYLQSLNKNGSRVWGDFGIAPSDSLFSFSNASLVTDGNSGAFVVWLEMKHYDSCSSVNDTPPSIRIQHFDSKGTTLWGDRGKEISIHDAPDAGSIKMISDGNGGTFISAYDRFHREIIVHKLDSKGQKMWGDKGISIRSPLYVENKLKHRRYNKTVKFSEFTQIKGYEFISNNKGGFYIVWNNEGISLIQNVSSKGSMLWESPLWIGGAENFNYTKLLANNNELIYINTPATDYGWFLVNITRINYTGEIISSYENASSTDKQWLMDALLAENGDVVIFWSEKSQEDSNKKYKLYVERVNTKRERVWGKSPLKSYSNSTHTAKLLSLGEKNYAVVWDDYLYVSNSGATSDYVSTKIYVQGISENGKLIKSNPVTIVDSKRLHGQSSLHAVSDAEGGIFVGWTDGKRTFSGSVKQDSEYMLDMADIYIQHVNANLNPDWDNNGIPASLLISNKHGGDVFIFNPYIEE